MHCSFKRLYVIYKWRFIDHIKCTIPMTIQKNIEDAKWDEIISGKMIVNIPFTIVIVVYKNKSLTQNEISNFKRIKSDLSSYHGWTLSKTVSKLCVSCLKLSKKKNFEICNLDFLEIPMCTQFQFSVVMRQLRIKNLQTIHCSLSFYVYVLFCHLKIYHINLFSILTSRIVFHFSKIFIFETSMIVI